MNWFSSFGELGRIVVIGFCAYVALVFLLRVSGNRTLSKMNSFDLVVTIALGSVFSAGVLQKSVALSDTIAAFAVLIALQYGVTWLTVRSKNFGKMVRSEPRVLVKDGRYLEPEMTSARVSVSEIFGALRQQNLSTLNQASLVVLESNGEITVVPTKVANNHRGEQ